MIWTLLTILVWTLVAATLVHRLVRAPREKEVIGGTPKAASTARKKKA
jgi:peptidoglycan/LPS O-acetylase OafA/YrhL